LSPGQNDIRIGILSGRWRYSNFLYGSIGKNAVPEGYGNGFTGIFYAFKNRDVVAVSNAMPPGLTRERALLSKTIGGCPGKHRPG
jgi:hypothetical protein